MFSILEVGTPSRKMEKRLVTAVLISIVFIAILQWASPKLFPKLDTPPRHETAATSTTSTASKTAPATKTTTTAAPASVPPVTVPTPPVAPVTPVAGERPQTTSVDTNDFVATFSNRGAELVSFKLKGYKNHDGTPVELVKARDPQRSDYPFALESADPRVGPRLNTALFALDDHREGNARVLTYRYAAADGVSATKTFRLTDEFLFSWNVKVTPGRDVRVAIGPGIRTLEKEESDSRFVVTGNGVAQIDDSLKTFNREKAQLTIMPNAQYVGIEDNYFLAVLRPDHGGASLLRAAEFPTDVKTVKRRDLYAAVNLANDGTASGAAFFGPKQTNIVDKYGFERTLQYGSYAVISYIARFFLICLTGINKFTHNYGWAIIVLTIAIKLVLFPLQQKSMSSMKKMQKLQPKVEAIKGRYKKAKTDPEQRQKMNMEVMKLYQQEGVNPAGGCLPLVIQFPIFIGFYNLLSHAIELRGQPWILWIHDLSQKDPYYITPLLMTVAMFIQQMITPSTADPAQKRMFMFMPLIFGWIFKEFPSGLVIYWLAQNVLTIVQQVIMNKFNDRDGDKQ